MIFLQKNYNSYSLIVRKKLDTSQSRDILQNAWPVLKIVEIIEKKEKILEISIAKKKLRRHN